MRSRMLTSIPVSVHRFVAGMLTVTVPDLSWDADCDGDGRSASFDCDPWKATMTVAIAPTSAASPVKMAGNVNKKDRELADERSPEEFRDMRLPPEGGTVDLCIADPVHAVMRRLSSGGPSESIWGFPR